MLEAVQFNVYERMYAELDTDDLAACFVEHT